MKFRYIFVLFLASFYSCKSSKNLSTVESSYTRFVMPELKSTLNVHYEIHKQAIKDTFNTLIYEFLSGDMEMTAMGMSVVINKREEADIEFSGKQVLTILPIEIGLSKQTFINNINAKGALVLNFITTMDMDSEWNLNTNTVLEHYEWLEEPQISLGGFSLPLGKLANTIIDESKAEFEKQIDKSVNEQLMFKDKVGDLMKYAEKPIEIDTALNSWIQLVPEKVYLSDMTNIKDWTVGNVTLQGHSIITQGISDEKTILNLPAFQWEESLDDTSHINLVFDISYKQINEYLIQNYKGKKFNSGSKEVTVNDIEIFSDGSKMVVKADVSGSFNGQVLLKGHPIFDNDKQMFYADNVDISIDTKNVFHKAGAWLLKGKIKKQLSELMYFSVSESISDLQTVIDQEVNKYSIPGTLEFNADLRKLNINKFVLGSDRIHTFMTLNMYLKALVYDMKVFDGSAHSRITKG